MILTERQVEYAKAIASGESYEAIAEDLGVSVQAVKNQVSLLSERLRVGGRAGIAGYVEAVTEAVEGLAAADDDWGW